MRENKKITENSLNREEKYYEYSIGISGRLSVLESKKPLILIRVNYKHDLNIYIE